MYLIKKKFPNSLKTGHSLSSLTFQKNKFLPDIPWCGNPDYSIILFIRNQLYPAYRARNSCQLSNNNHYIWSGFLMLYGLGNSRKRREAKDQNRRTWEMNMSSSLPRHVYNWVHVPWSLFLQLQRQWFLTSRLGSKIGQIWPVASVDLWKRNLMFKFWQNLIYVCRSF